MRSITVRACASGATEGGESTSSPRPSVSYRLRPIGPPHLRLTASFMSFPQWAKRTVYTLLDAYHRHPPLFRRFVLGGPPPDLISL